MPNYLNRFSAPEFIEETIIRESDNKVIGTIRVKPSSVLWKPKGAHAFYSVPLDRFVGWITGPDAKANKTKR